MDYLSKNWAFQKWQYISFITAFIHISVHSKSNFSIKVAKTVSSIFHKNDKIN